MSDYSLLICPVCLEQVSDDPEYGSTCYHDEYGNVEAIRVKVEPQGLTPARGLALFRLQEDKREIAFREADRRWFANLPKEERDRLESERRASMSSHERLMEDAVKSMIADTRRSILAQIL